MHISDKLFYHHLKTKQKVYQGLQTLTDKLKHSLLSSTSSDIVVGEQPHLLAIEALMLFLFRKKKWWEHMRKLI